MPDLTPEQWRDRLLIDLNKRRPEVACLYAYYEGEHPDPTVTADVRDAYRALLRISKSNWLPQIIRARSTRLRPIGLRFSEGSENTDTDLTVWKRAWQSNRLDADSRLIHDAALVARRGFALVWPGVEGAAPTITPEHPAEVIVAYKAGSRRIRLAALKCFTDQIAGFEYACLWLPESIHLWKRPVITSTLYQPNGQAFGEGGWGEWFDAEVGIFPEAENPLGFVPMYEFQADPQLSGEPRSVLDGGVLAMQDRINQGTLGRLVSSERSAFQQKWATGLEIPLDPETQEPIEPFRSAVDRLFVNENPDGAFGAFPVPDMQNLIRPIEADVQHLMAMTSTPLHIVGLSQNPPAAETLKAAEAPLVTVCRDATVCLSETWEDVVRGWCAADGRPDLAGDMSMQVLWADPELRSDEQIADAATKRKAVGVPWRQTMEYLGYSPVEIDRMDAQRQKDAALVPTDVPMPESSPVT